MAFIFLRMFAPVIGAAYTMTTKREAHWSEQTKAQNTEKGMYVGLKQPRGDGERCVTPARAAAKETRYMRDERHVEGLRDEGYTHLTVNYSQNFVDPDTRAHTQRIENTWWGVIRSMRRIGTSKDLFESYLQEWLWRQYYGDDPFGNIIKHIAALYEVRKDP